MKHYLQRLFEFMGQPENFTLSLILIMIYTLFVAVAGMALAWCIYYLVNKHVDKRPYSFDDFIEEGNGHSGFRVTRRVK